MTVQIGDMIWVRLIKTEKSKGKRKRMLVLPWEKHIRMSNVTTNTFKINFHSVFFEFYVVSNDSKITISCSTGRLLCYREPTQLQFLLWKYSKIALFIITTLGTSLIIVIWVS